MSGAGRAVSLAVVAFGAAVATAACDREDLTVATLDAGEDSGIPSCFNDEDCPTEAYCDKPGCGPRGQCRFPPPCADDDGGNQFGVRDPQCGCNGVTYWNLCDLQNAYQSLRASDECPDDEHTLFCHSSDDCTAVTGNNHPTHCAKLPAGDHACDADDLMGTCWSVPLNCVEVTNDPALFLPCDSQDFHCMSECSAIFSGTVATFAEDSCR